MLIVHRCTKCGKPDIFVADYEQTTIAGGKVKGHAVIAKHQRKCCRPDGRWGPPETMRRYRLHGTFNPAVPPINEIAKPGDSPGQDWGTTCNCDACHALYAELTGAPK